MLFEGRPPQLGLRPVEGQALNADLAASCGWSHSVTQSRSQAQYPTNRHRETALVYVLPAMDQVRSSKQSVGNEASGSPNSVVAHKDGKGFNVVLNPVPVNGELILRETKEPEPLAKSSSRR